MALIPARAGSKRITDKNIRPLAGHPLIAYTISSALQSQVFSAVIVSTDSQLYGDIAGHYGAEVPHLRPADIAGDLSPDIEWVEYTLNQLGHDDREYDCFSILRPTSPFVFQKQSSGPGVPSMTKMASIHFAPWRNASSTPVRCG